MKLSPATRKLTLAVHLTVSIGWVGGVLVYVALGLAATRSDDDQTIRAAWVAMEITGWYALVPMALATVLTGLILAWGTKWGLLRHYWVLIAFVLTLFSAVILILHMPTVSATADAARTAKTAQLQLLGGDLFHSTIGLVVLLGIQVLNIYKPRGQTRYGWRAQSRPARAPATRHAQTPPEDAGQSITQMPIREERIGNTPSCSATAWPLWPSGLLIGSWTGGRRGELGDSAPARDTGGEAPLTPARVVAAQVEERDIRRFASGPKSVPT